MAPPWLPLPFLFLSSVLFTLVQLCEIPGENILPIQTLNLKLLKLADEASQEPNPSIYVGLRLSNYHDLEKESQYFNQLMDIFQPQSSSSRVPSEVSYQKRPGTGQLALYLLALRGACHNTDTPERNRVVTQLKLHLNREKKQIDRKDKGHPITNYYQYSLGILALCIHNKKIDHAVIRKLLLAEQHGKFRHQGALSVDTEAMAGLGFVCLGQASGYPHNLLTSMSKGVQRVKAKILQAQTPEGFYGNIYSSPLAVQFLNAAGMGQSQPAFSRGLAALIRSLKRGDFQNSLIQSQLLPALFCKSYLDLAGLICQTQTENVILDASLQKPQEINPTQNISVWLEARRASQLLYNRTLEVPLGSTLLNVLEAAAKDGPQPLRFETQKTLSGPMLIGVMGVKSEEGEHKYWRILQHPHSNLDQGIAEYIPQDQEHIILKMSSW